MPCQKTEGRYFCYFCYALFCCFGADNAGGAMYLIDRDGTILSTSTDAEELEPLIRKALNIE